MTPLWRHFQPDRAFRSRPLIATRRPARRRRLRLSRRQALPALSRTLAGSKERVGRSRAHLPASLLLGFPRPLLALADLLARESGRSFQSLGLRPGSRARAGQRRNPEQVLHTCPVFLPEVRDVRDERANSAGGGTFEPLAPEPGLLDDQPPMAQAVYRVDTPA